jgi:hypothetical protein
MDRSGQRGGSREPNGVLQEFTSIPVMIATINPQTP